MKRLLFLATLILLALPAVAGATSDQSQARLDIYAVHCLFEQINNGAGQITFLTPAECNQKITLNSDDPQLQGVTPVVISNPNSETTQRPVDQSGELQSFLANLSKLATFGLNPPLPAATIAGAVITAFLMQAFIGKELLGFVIRVLRLIVSLITSRG